MEREWKTESGIDVERIYRPTDGQVPESVGEPGKFPFTRGIHEEMYRRRLWTMRQYSGFGDADASNERFRELIKAGQNGISVAFDLPTQLGYDSDDPAVVAEVGRVGVAIDTLDDLDDLLADIPLETANANFTINAPACVIVAMYAAVARRRQADLTTLRGTVQNDIIKEFLSRGTYVFPPEPSVRMVGDVIEYCADVMPHFYPISVSGGHIRDAGATGLQAWGCMLASGYLYLDECVRRGLDVSRSAARFSFLVNSRQDPLVEAAQFRAVRRLWATSLRERYGIESEDALKFRFFSGVSNMMFTRQEPLNNIVRGVLGCLGVVLGGGQALTNIGYDEAYEIPTVEAQRIALRTQQIVAYETLIPATVDPLGGSYYVEAMTNEFEAKLSEFINGIDEHGGMIKAIEEGWLQALIFQNAYEWEKGKADGSTPLVGVNLFADDSMVDGEGASFEMVGELHEPDETVAVRQAERLAQHRQRRDGQAVDTALKSVREAAVEKRNIVYPIEDALLAGATIGEIVKELKSVFGVYMEGGRV